MNGKYEKNIYKEGIYLRGIPHESRPLNGFALFEFSLNSKIRGKCIKK